MFATQTLSFQGYTTQAPATVFLPLARPAKTQTGMRELTLDEIDCVGGGFLGFEKVNWYEVTHVAAVLMGSALGASLGGPWGAVAGGVAVDILWQMGIPRE